MLYPATRYLPVNSSSCRGSFAPFNTLPQTLLISILIDRYTRFFPDGCQLPEDSLKLSCKPRVKLYAFARGVGKIYTDLAGIVL